MAQNISKECFPPPTRCCNCHQKNRQGITKIQEASKEFKRCSGCHLLSYCDKDCQKEHWDKIHKKHWKFLSGKKVVEGVKHVADSCSLCIQEKKTNFSDITSCDSPKTSCHVADMVRGMKILLGGIFEFHSEGKTCSCSTKFACELPFPIGEITGIYIGDGVDEMLAHALKILNAMKLKRESANYGFRDKFKEYFITISLLRVKNWGNILIHGPELQGGIDLSEMTSLVEDVKTTYGINHAWLAALSFTSDFVLELDKRLEFMKCDSSSLGDHRFPILKRMREFCESQVKLCQEKNALVNFKLWPSVTGGSLVILLPEDIHCGNCQALLTGPVSVDLKPGADETRPALLTYAGKQGGGPVASCPIAERMDCWVNCAMQNMYYRIQVEGLWKQLDQEYLLFISEIRYCDMCQLASLSSHRCTECLAAQYCSKECQRKDLAFHKTVCSQWAKDKARKLFRGKKQVEINASKLMKRCKETIGK